MAKLPDNVIDSQTVQAIYAAYERVAERRFSRRVGASQVGKECARALWYDFRWAGREDFDGRMLRLFETGHLEEPRFVANLRAIGCEVHDRDPETDQQWEFTDVDGHMVAKLDGAALGIPEAPKTWHAVSMKTASAKSFAQIKAKGIKAGKPEHYGQAIVELKMSGLTRCLYLVRNKDTDELYSERIRWEDVREDAERLIGWARSVIDAKTPPARIAEDRDDRRCRFCSHVDRCHGSAAPSPAVPVQVNCRTCVHATPEHDTTFGRWSCARHGRTLSEAEQARGCDDHLFIPDFITFADVTDGGYDPAGDWVEYTGREGQVWKQGKQTGHYRSKELTILPAPLVAADMIAAVKDTLGGVVVEEVG